MRACATSCKPHGYAPQQAYRSRPRCSASSHAHAQTTSITGITHNDYCQNARRPRCCARAGCVMTSNAAFGAKPDASGKLGQRGEQLLLEAQQAGKSRVILLIAVKSGASNQAVSDISRLGGQIQFRDDALGYLRASVPVSQAKAVAALSSIQSVDVDELVPLPDPRPEGAVATVPQPPPTAATPRINPYMPTGETGAAQFVQANPTWDGRGVTIGVVDLRHHSRSPQPGRHLDRRKKDRGLGHGHRPIHGRRSDVAEHERAGIGRPVCFQRRHVYRAGGGRLPNCAVQRARPAARR